VATVRPVAAGQQRGVVAPVTGCPYQSCRRVDRDKYRQRQIRTGFAAIASGPPHTTGGYLFHGCQDGAWQGVVQAPGLSLSLRLPTLIVWLSIGLRGPGVAW
jgi:hypothetical protein